MSENNVRILAVDDERAIQRFLNTALTAHGYHVYQAINGQEALTSVIEHRPHVIILDLGLPDMDGIEVVKQLREWSDLPIIILSVREHESDKIAALDAGADDYLTKPFGVGELMARLRAALRRTSGSGAESTFVFGDLTVDLARRVVRRGTEEIQLTPTEYDLLRVLVLHAGKVLTHRSLLQQVWGDRYDEEIHLLRVNISNLRRKLEPEPSRPRHIVTEPGVGYRFTVE